MPQIHLITPPDLLMNDNRKVLLVNPDEQIKSDFSKAILDVQEHVNLYLYDNHPQTDWLIKVANMCDAILINADRMQEDRWLLGYLLAINNSCYFTSQEQLPYHLINGNRKYDCAQFVEFFKGLK